MNKRPEMDIPAQPLAGEEDTPAAPPAPRRARLGRQLLLALVLLALGAAGWKVIMAFAPTPHVRKAVEKPVAVQVITARPVSIRPTWILYGEVAPARMATLQMPVSGRISQVSAKWKNGAEVRKGEELLRIEDLVYRAAVREAEAQLKEAEVLLAEARGKMESEQRLLREAEAQFRVAQREFDRVRTLVQRGTLPKSKLDQQQQKYLSAREKLESRKQALAVARARLAQRQAVLARVSWALEKARDNLKKTVLRAPFDGQLTNVRAEVGQQAGPSVQLATLVDADAPEVLFQLPEARLLALRRAGEQAVGRKVRVVVNTRTGEVSLPATVTREGARVDRKSGAISLYATPDDPQQAAWLKPGAFAQVRMRGPLLRDVVLLPEAALADGNSVMIVRDGRLARLPVKLLGMDEGKVIVTGVPAGVRVVSHRLAHPQPGQPVRIVSSKAGAG